VEGYPVVTARAVFMRLGSAVCCQSDELRHQNGIYRRENPKIPKMESERQMLKDTLAQPGSIVEISDICVRPAIPLCQPRTNLWICYLWDQSDQAFLLGFIVLFSQMVADATNSVARECLGCSTNTISSPLTMHLRRRTGNVGGESGRHGCSRWWHQHSCRKDAESRTCLVFSALGDEGRLHLRTMS
jgi:hypothetical protein